MVLGNDPQGPVGVHPAPLQAVSLPGQGGAQMQMQTGEGEVSQP